MRTLGLAAAAAAVLLLASHANAQDPAAPTDAPAPAAPPAPAPAPAPAAFPPNAEASSTSAAESPEAPPARPLSSGIRLAADLGFQRASTSIGNSVPEGTPSLIPLGVELAFHTSERMLFGFHAFYGIGSRSDCLSGDKCIARGYGGGGQLEVTLGHGQTWIPWFRYGMGIEGLYHGGTAADRGGYTYRTGFDLVDARFGVDYVVSRAADGRLTRLGAYLGMNAGLQLSETGATSKSNVNFDNDSGDGHVWFTIGFRGAIDP